MGIHVIGNDRYVRCVHIYIYIYIHTYIKPRSGLFIEGFLLKLTYATAPLPELGQHVRNQNMFFWISVGRLCMVIPLNFFVEIDACDWLPWWVQLKRIQQTEFRKCIVIKVMAFDIIYIYLTSCNMYQIFTFAVNCMCFDEMNMYDWCPWWIKPKCM